MRILFFFLPISAIFDTVFWAFLWSRSQVYSLNIRKKRASLGSWLKNVHNVTLWAQAVR
ncbi:hypothetical protein N44_03339 [Microcystis aeruginosa NIES-44]|uniref:Uncharacterized protein n=1 Tax=Microcystis aeruginosa NIES-44 TaxID=449439 RepID=A0A0A1VZ05_MICAE|nr:hypothetical protein N44_03339 [Microcystis aeruginosa NIES-44]